MKKIFCIVFSFILIFISGCNKKSSDVTAVTTGLSFTAKINHNDILTVYDVIINDNGDLTLTTISGNNEGLIINFRDNKAILNFNGLTCETDISSLPEGIIADFLYSIFQNAENTPVYLEDEEYYISGETAQYQYKIHLSKMGLPIKIEDNKNNISVIIKNVSIIE